MPLLRKVLTALLFVPALSVFAQNYPVDKFVFKGGDPYTDAELLATAAATPGEVFTADTLAGPAQHLLDTGLFDSAEMSLGGPGNRTATIILKPTPTSALMSASFANFIWWTPEELTVEIHKRVPLYRGYCSDAGNFPNLIQAALQQMLTDKAIHAILAHIIVEPTTEQPHRVTNFVIQKPRVYVASIGLGGVPAALAPATQAMSNRLTKTDYNEGLAGFSTEYTLLYPALDAGYITATLSSIKRDATASADGIAIAYSAQMAAGEPYKVSSITWQATPIYSAANFEKDNTLHPGDLASIKPLRAVEAKIIIAYRANGYIDAYVDPGPQRDDTAHNVAYALQAIPGEVYRLKSVEARGLSPEAQQEFDSAWRIKPNDVYNESYVANFIHNNTALRHLAVYSASYQAVGDPATHLVDLTLTFFAGQTSH